MDNNVSINIEEQLFKDNEATECLSLDVHELYYYHPTMAGARFIQIMCIIFTILLMIKLIKYKYQKKKINKILVITCLICIVLTISLFILKIPR